MRAYLRLGPSFGVSMPWWAAIFAAMIWLTLAMLYLFYVGIAVLVLFGWRKGRAAWARRQPPA